MSFLVSHAGTFTTSTCTACPQTYSERNGDLSRQQRTHDPEACARRREAARAQERSLLAAVDAAHAVIEEAPKRVRGALTECIHGHEFTPENTRIDRGKYKVCRTCVRDNDAIYYARKKAAKEANTFCDSVRNQGTSGGSTERIEISETAPSVTSKPSLDTPSKRSIQMQNIPEQRHARARLNGVA